MTMSPPGDKGQRYEISCFGYPFAGQNCIVAWSEYRTDAEAAMKIFRTCPGATSVTIRDRWKATPEWPDHKFTMYCGVLR